METIFKTIILGFGNNTGIEIPIENLNILDSGKRAPVIVHVNGYNYKSTVNVMNDKYLISLPKAHREAAGLKVGDNVTVKLVLDAGIRVVEVPRDLRDSLKQADLLTIFEELAYSKRKEFCRQVVEAKTNETRNRRIDKIIESLNQGNN
jgi:bifunctional DNA-binding transcriptional regulator/antitoxin component of YhaV-PrlF toxin-antitoxin module